MTAKTNDETKTEPIEWSPTIERTFDATRERVLQAVTGRDERKPPGAPTRGVVDTETSIDVEE